MFWLKFWQNYGNRWPWNASIKQTDYTLHCFIITCAICTCSIFCRFRKIKILIHQFFLNCIITLLFYQLTLAVFIHFMEKVFLERHPIFYKWVKVLNFTVFFLSPMVLSTICNRKETSFLATYVNTKKASPIIG